MLVSIFNKHFLLAENTGSLECNCFSRLFFFSPGKTHIFSETTGKGFPAQVRISTQNYSKGRSLKCPTARRDNGPKVRVDMRDGKDPAINPCSTNSEALPHWSSSEERSCILILQQKMFSWHIDSKRKLKDGDSEDLTSSPVPGQVGGLEQARGLDVPLSPYRNWSWYSWATFHRQLEINVCTNTGCVQHY